MYAIIIQLHIVKCVFFSYEFDIHLISCYVTDSDIFIPNVGEVELVDFKFIILVKYV